MRWLEDIDIQPLTPARLVVIDEIRQKLGLDAKPSMHAALHGMIIERASLHAFNPDQPRDEKGRWAQGASAIGHDPSDAQKQAAAAHPAAAISKMYPADASSLNGIRFNHYQPQSNWANVSCQAKIAEPPMPKPSDYKPFKYVDSDKEYPKTLSSGIIMREPDGKVWLVRPMNEYGGYKYTFPKGGIEKGLSAQANAIKETYEETGLKARITGFAGDHEGSTTITRYYFGAREAGSPTDHGRETYKVELVHPDKLLGVLNRTRDKEIAIEHILKPKSSLHSAIIDRAISLHFNPDEARDPRGRWTSGGGADDAPNQAVTDKAAMLRARYDNPKRAEPEYREAIKKMSDREVVALLDYTGDSRASKTLNEKIRTGVELNDKEKSFARNLWSAMEKLPQSSDKSFRVMKLSEQEIEGYKVGREIIDASFTSTAQASDAFGVYSGKGAINLIYEPNSGEGAKIDGLSRFPDEQEVLRYPGQQYIIDKVYKDFQGTTFAHLSKKS